MGSCYEMHARHSHDGGTSNRRSKCFGTTQYRQHHDLVAVLIGHQQETVARRDCEIARPSTAARPDSDADQPPVRLDCKDGDAVMSPIGDVDTISQWRDVDVGNCTLRCSRRQRLDDLPLPQSTVCRIVVVHRDGVVEFVGDIHELAIWMEGEVPRTGTWTCDGVGMFMKPTGRRCDSVD